MNRFILTGSAITISPPGDSSLYVCSGDQLELTCSLTDPNSSLLEWTFAPVTIFMNLYRAIDGNSLNDDTPVIVDSTLLTFSRISPKGHLPLMSTLLIDPLTIGLNGIVINCTAVSPIQETATTTVYVMNRHSSGMSC